MKLVELLARELKHWPECKTITQDWDGDTGLYRIDTPELCNGDPNDAVWTAMGHIENIKRPSEVATDHASAIVTREMWQAEKDRIAAPKQTKDGWIRHRGGKCPVDAGTVIDVRYRSGIENERVKALVFADAGGSVRFTAMTWTHTNCGQDIMAYRVCEPVIEPVSIDQIDAGIAAADDGKLAPIEVVKAAYAGPIQWRDRITQIDADIKFEQERHSSNMACMDQERADLVAKLAAEGFALIAPVVAPAEDMSDWRNWRAGDLLECVNPQSRHYTSGKPYKFISASVHGSIRAWDDREVENGLMPVYFKFHSRPTN